MFNDTICREKTSRSINLFQSKKKYRNSLIRPKNNYKNLVGDYDTNSQSRISTSQYYADSSMSSGNQTELTNKEEVDYIIFDQNNEELQKCSRRYSTDSYSVGIVRHLNSDHFYNYEELLEKIKEEEKNEIHIDRNSIKKSKDKKKPNINEIYISDQEDKEYDPYKIEYNYIEKMNKEIMKNHFMEYLKKEKEKNEEKKEDKRPCYELCCIIY